MPFWDQSKKYKAMNEKKASKKTQNAFMNSFNIMRQANCEHQYRDGKCIKCNKEGSDAKED